MQERDNQNLDNIIRSSFEKKSKAAPDNLWAKLSSTMDAHADKLVEEALLPDPLDNKIKDSFLSLKESAPEHVWPTINRQLNIDNVWLGITAELDKSRPLYWPGIRIAAAILLLLLSGAGAYSLYFSNEAKKPQAHTAENAVVETEQAVPNNKAAVALDLAAEARVKHHVPYKGTPAAVTSQLPENARSSAENTLPTTKAPSQGRRAAAYAGKPKHTGVASAALTAEAEGIAESRQSTDSVGLADLSVGQAAVQETSTGAEFTADNDVSGVKEIAKAYLPQHSVRPTNHSSAKVEKQTADDEKLISLVANGGGTAVADKHEPFTHVAGIAVPAGRGEIGQRAAETMPYNVRGIAFTPVGGAAILDIEVIPADTVASDAVDWASLISKAPKEAFRLRKFEAGPVMVYNNSWLLNNETKSSYDKNSLIATDPTYKQNWGMVFHYRFSKKNALSSEMYIVGKAGQQYKMYRNGEYLKRELELRYHKLYLQYQRNFLMYGKNIPSWLSLQAGAYGGYLQNKVGEIRSEESRYAKFDYGLKLALGQEHDLKRFVLGYGISAERGLNNVFRGTEHLPAAFNKTYILNLGAYLNIRYAF